MAISINGAECIACGACVSACPLDLITVSDVAVIEDTDSCIECGSCVDACPLGIIEL
ncbi:MAG: 4Fe-4S binding protein [Coriobacteriales bacterium]|nr:4Fe-4S binding protein [Coriobacteriales bacterium]